MSLHAAAPSGLAPKTAGRSRPSREAAAASRQHLDARSRGRELHRVRCRAEWRYLQPVSRSRLDAVRDHPRIAPVLVSEPYSVSGLECRGRSARRDGGSPIVTSGSRRPSKVRGNLDFEFHVDGLGVPNATSFAVQSKTRGAGRPARSSAGNRHRRRRSGGRRRSRRRRRPILR